MALLNCQTVRTHWLSLPQITRRSMIISYNWLSEYLPEKIEPELLSRILTSIGLEVESMEPWETFRGGLKGLVVGEVLECSKHPDADKLSLTRVTIGAGEPLQIVCGAPNVAVGQKVVVAPVGATLYPLKGEPLTMKKAKIRGVESFGMICAEDEIGLSDHHEGIMVLRADALPGTPAADYFGNSSDIVYHIGLTPNRMDAMSHLGVARDVCAWLSHHRNKPVQVKSPLNKTFKPDQPGQPVTVDILSPEACRRYAGVLIRGVAVGESPAWLQQKLKAIGLRPINNIVDITNFILHETGQPLHAFDAAQIRGNRVLVKQLPEGTPFVTLDEKERKLAAGDLMICNAEAPMCIAGVYGGLHSGVSTATRDIFLESAWFSPASVRSTSFRHGLRTDAATRFEKGVDIGNTVNVLKRAALLIRELAGGSIASDVVDVYPDPRPKTEVILKYHYLKKLSGKHYHIDTVKDILTALGFEILKEGMDELHLAVPYSKPDISLQADIVEEIMRIDGLDNVEIPSVISIAPATETLGVETACRERTAQQLAGMGFSEIFTNSITNSAYYDEAVLARSVRMINSLSAELDILRPSMLETGLEAVAYNLNRKNLNLRLFEFGKTYSSTGVGKYAEQEHLALFLSGAMAEGCWKGKAVPADFFYLKGLVEKILLGLGAGPVTYAAGKESASLTEVLVKQEPVAVFGAVPQARLNRFDIRQPVWYADINWNEVLALHKKQQITFREIPKFPAVQRDLSMVVDRSVAYEQVQEVTGRIRISRLQSVKLFDVFENEKLGAGRKSMALNFTFLDEEKTMTDQDIDTMMAKIMTAFERELGAEIRKS